MTRPKQATLIAHVPVISRGYFEFLKDAEASVNQGYILDSSITGPIDGVRKDLRRLDAEIAASLIKPHLIYPIQTIGKAGLANLIETSHDLLLVPDDEITESIVKEYELDPERLLLQKIFLRWDRINTISEAPVEFDNTIRQQDLNPKLVSRLLEEVANSKDWWRQVGCVVFSEENDSSVMLSSHNRYVPSDDTAEIEGDIRSQSNRGTSIEYANAQHAEASVVAQAAREGIKLEGKTCLVSTFPCPVCAKLLAQSGITKVIFSEGYATGDGQSILRQAGVSIVKLVDLDGPKNTSTKPVQYIK